MLKLRSPTDRASTAIGARPSRRGTFARLALASLLVHGCGDTPAEPPPGPPVGADTAVHEITVTPASAFLDPGDTLRLSATARTRLGAVVAEPGIVWRSLSPAATVDATGKVRAEQAGEVRIEAAAANGVIGSATVRVTPVAAIQPDTGRYGQLVTLSGSAFPAEGEVYFTRQSGGRVRASERSRSSTAVEVWVPVGAANGPLLLVAPGDSVVTSRGFRLTADEDIFSTGEADFVVPFPFENPSLLARSGETHRIAFSVTEPTPFSLVLEDRGDPHVDTTVRGWLFRTDPAPVTLVSFLMTRRHAGDGGGLDEAVYGRSLLPPGEYVLLVAAMNLENPADHGVRRPFGLRMNAAARFDLSPDAFAPNDFPAEAPTVGTAFGSGDLRAENGYAMDHYAIDVSETSLVRATTMSDAPWLLMVLFPEGPVDVIEAWEEVLVLAENDGSQNDGEIEARVPPGRYTLLVWEWGGRARPYALEITMTPAPGDVALPTGMFRPGMSRSGPVGLPERVATPPRRPLPSPFPSRAGGR